MAGQCHKFPESWSFSALRVFALVTACGSGSGQTLEGLIELAQIIVGMSLGTKFQHERLQRLKCAMAFGLLTLLSIMSAIGLITIIFSQILLIDAPMMVLTFFIDGLKRWC